MPEQHPFTNNKWLNNIQPTPPGIWFNNNQSFAFMPNKNVKNLFLGTFPTFEVVHFIRHQGNKEFYYGSTRNNFWPILSIQTGIEINSEIDCMNLLIRANFGISDILFKIERIEQKAADNALTPIIFNNFENLLENFPMLENIFVTSGGKTPITNGSPKSTSKWLRDSLIADGFNVTGFNVKGYKKHITISKPNQLAKKLNVISLLSPSDAANKAAQATINRHTLMPILEAFPQELMNTRPVFRANLLQNGYMLSGANFPIVAPLQKIINDNIRTLEGIYGV